MWIKRRRRRSQSTTFGWDQFGFPMVEHRKSEEWVEEIHIEKKNRPWVRTLLTAGTTILLGLVTNALYDKIKTGELLQFFVSLQQKTATLMAAAPDYMADVWRNLHVVLESLL